MSEIEELTERILGSPASRARILAESIEILESNGVDVNSDEFSALLGADVSNRESFTESLAASTVVIAIASAGQRQAISDVASTVVIAIASAGQRQAISDRASTVVIAIASAGQRQAISDVASTVVIAIASAGQRQAISDVASTVVIAIASAGQRQAFQESAPIPGQIVVNLPSVERIGAISAGLRQLADQLDAEQSELSGELAQAIEQVSGGQVGGDAGPGDAGSGGTGSGAAKPPKSRSRGKGY